MNSAVCNASPLIALAKSGWLDLLPKLFREIYVSEAVVNEILAGPPGDPMREGLAGIEWIRRVRLEPPLSPLAVWHLGRGEAEVLEYARLHEGTAAVLDDCAGRRAARGLGVPVHGTLSLLAMGVKNGHVGSFPEAVQGLRQAGLYVSERIVREITEGLKRTD
jgi:predicted nucleic acid-binding protein